MLASITASPRREDSPSPRQYTIHPAAIIRKYLSLIVLGFISALFTLACVPIREWHFHAPAVIPSRALELLQEVLPPLVCGQAGLQDGVRAKLKELEHEVSMPMPAHCVNSSASMGDVAVAISVWREPELGPGRIMTRSGM